MIRPAVIVLSFLLLSSPPVLQRWIGGDTRAYIVATIALALLYVWIVGTWRDGLDGRDGLEGQDGRDGQDGRRAAAIVAGLIAAVLLVVVGRAWLQQILTVPIDPLRGDMLVVIREGLRRVSLGGNPYTIYHVPWEAPLPYGPLMWGPLAVPFLLRIDLRFFTVAGALFVPLACAAGAIACAWRGRLAAAAGSLLMLAAIGWSGELARFTLVGHTPVYWPLLALFAWLVVRRRWFAAAVALGLLIAARSTMVAMAPVLLMAVWRHDRRAWKTAAALVVLAAGLPFLPFAIWDLKALTYAMYGSYEKVIKEVVWVDPTVPHTIGLTGVLLSHQWQRAVEAVQILVLSVVYIGCWLALRRGRAPIAVMGVALLAFSMTTLWPVYYLYFDVFLLLASGVIAAASAAGTTPSTGRVAWKWAALLTLDAALVAVAAWMLLPPDATVFAPVWHEPQRQTSIAAVRRTASAAIVDVELGSALPAPPDRMTIALNGVPLGEIGSNTPGDRWILATPASAWHIGANALDVTGASPLAIGRVVVRPAR